MTDSKKLTKGSCLCEHQFYRVDKIAKGQIQLINDNGEYIVVTEEYANNCLISANQFEKTEKLTRSELASLFLANPNMVMTVSFNTLVKEEDVVKQILDAYETSTPKAFGTSVKSAVKDALVGKERIIVGRHYGSMNELGRIQFVDMEISKDASKSYDTRLRLVDPRGINWIIMNNVKYIIK